MPRKFQTRRRPPTSRKAGFKFVSAPTAVVFGLLLVLLGAGYLAEINTTSAKGYQIRTLESEISDLKQQGERLELQVAKEQSVQAVEQKVQDMGMVPTPKVEYMMATVPQVAKR